MFIFQFAGFIFTLCALPALFGWVAFGIHGLILGVAGMLLLLLLDSLRVQKIFLKTLQPTSVFLYGKKVYRIEDASSHLFVTQGPWMPSKIWITRGAFSLLTQAELHTLVLQARKTHPFFKLSFESYLTTLLIRLEKWLPKSLYVLSYSTLENIHPVRIRDILFGLPVFGMMSVLGFFYGRFAFRPSAAASVRTALGVLERESKICTPQVSPSLGSHALIAPWPHALVRFGRPCLS